MKGTHIEDVRMFTQFIQATMAIALTLGMATGLHADTMAAPKGTPLLTVSGEVSVTNVDDTLVLDRDMLMALETTSFETSTIWTDGVHTFEGVSLKTLTQFLGLEDGTMLATAINDYTVEIPLSDAVEGGPIIAYLMDGNTMSVRDKGPLWVVYPYDSNADYRSEVTYARSIWQLDRVEFVQ